VLVVELAQLVLGSNNQYWGDGVLIYTVDARIATGDSPVVVIPKKASISSDYGYLHEAPYQVNDVANFKEGWHKALVLKPNAYLSSNRLTCRWPQRAGSHLAKPRLGGG
jgi:hypothetical protein